MPCKGWVTGQTFPRERWHLQKLSPNHRKKGWGEWNTAVGEWDLNFPNKVSTGQCRVCNYICGKLFFILLCLYSHFWPELHFYMNCTIFYTILELTISQLCAACCSEREDLTVDGILEYNKYIIIAALSQNKNLLGLISRLWHYVAPWVMQLSFLSVHIGSKHLLPKCLQWLFQIPHFIPRICYCFLRFLFSKFVWSTIYFFLLPELWEIF